VIELYQDAFPLALVYCFAKIDQRERAGEEGRLTHLWLIVLVLLLMLYGWYSWAVKH